MRSTIHEHPSLTVLSGHETYREFQLEQRGHGIVASVQNLSDFERFPWLLAAAPDLLRMVVELQDLLRQSNRGKDAVADAIERAQYLIRTIVGGDRA